MYVFMEFSGGNGALSWKLHVVLRNRSGLFNMIYNGCLEMDTRSLVISLFSSRISVSCGAGSGCFLRGQNYMWAVGTGDVGVSETAVAAI